MTTKELSDSEYTEAVNKLIDQGKTFSFSGIGRGNDGSYFSITGTDDEGQPHVIMLCDRDAASYLRHQLTEFLKSPVITIEKAREKGFRVRASFINPNRH